MNVGALMLVVAFLAGTVVAGTYAVDAYESAIPPTNAFDQIGVDMTYTWGNVTADTSYDDVFFVSDGSIWFNVTEAPPP